MKFNGVDVSEQVKEAFGSTTPSESIVTEVTENEDGGATIVLDFTAGQKALLWDVFLRNAICDGLLSMEKNSERFAEYLAKKEKEDGLQEDI
jgi:hypothetical protein